MKSFFVAKNLTYDGSQLQSLYAYLEHQVSGPSIIAWVGPCAIPHSHMVDGEDLIQRAVIRGDEMLHFIIEVFDRDLFSGVALQRLFAALAKDYLQSQGAGLLTNAYLHREGDDIFLGSKKLSISIASKSPVSVMVHFAMNVSNEGTPVETLSLGDLNLSPIKVAEDLMQLFTLEFTSILTATQKVRPLP